MKHVGVRDFKDHATTLLAGGETLVVERHGTPVGFYVPVHAMDRPSGHEALGRLGAALEDIYARTGLTEDEVAADISRPRRRRS
ncbi:MAG TPA: hypothetical protein VGL26_08855 [Jatrophihabitans sp.]|jgi:antitoxin (DNA-binding transcriptional repressor) of toxin-antitoxin stability system